MRKGDGARGEADLGLEAPGSAVSSLPACAANLLSRDTSSAPTVDTRPSTIGCSEAFSIRERALADACRPAACVGPPEVGVGTGLTLPGYPPSAAVVGVDISAEMLASTRARRTSSRPQHSTRVDGRRGAHVSRPLLRVRHRSYVLSVTPDPRRLVAEIRRVCWIGGTILILNHFSGGRFWWLLERAMRPLASRVGFRSDFGLAGEVSSYDWTVEWVKDVNFLGLSKLVSVRNV
jgi:phosphatidylethanolamine/phosphatidyl-N-methylethanolamine N-methyltransferase